MPMYDYRCPSCWAVQAIFKRIAQLPLQEWCGRCGDPMNRQLSAPAVRGDYPGYACPITNKWVEGRRAHAENLKIHGCRLLEPGETSAVAAAHAKEEADFERRFSDSIEEEIHRLPSRKRELLAAEVEGGLDVSVVRSSPTKG